MINDILNNISEKAFENEMSKTSAIGPGLLKAWKGLAHIAKPTERIQLARRMAGQAVNPTKGKVVKSMTGPLTRANEKGESVAHRYLSGNKLPREVAVNPSAKSSIQNHGSALKNWRQNIVAEAPAPIKTTGKSYNPHSIYQGTMPKPSLMDRISRGTNRLVDRVSTL